MRRYCDWHLSHASDNEPSRGNPGQAARFGTALRAAVRGADAGVPLRHDDAAGQSRSCRVTGVHGVDELGASAELELLEHMGEVGLDRRLADEERVGDLLVGQTIGDEHDHLLLPV